MKTYLLFLSLVLSGLLTTLNLSAATSLIANSLSNSSTNSLEKCLSNPNNNTKSCAEKNIKNLTLNNCFSEAEKIKSALSKENLMQYCFYSISEFPTLNTCLALSEKMKVALNHDEALFECIHQFQNQLTPERCIQISKKMRYPEKSEHLRRNCDQL